MADDNPYARYAQSPVTFQSPQTAPDIAHTVAQTQETTAMLPSKVQEGRAKATTAQAEASQALPQQIATTQQKQADARKSQFQSGQEKLTLQHQEAQIRMFNDNIGKTLDVVNQARQYIQQSPGQFDPASYRILEHIPGTAANKFAALIDPENGPLAANQVLNTINAFRAEAGANPGGGGSPPRVFRSEIPLFASQSGSLKAGTFGPAELMHTLDKMEYYGARSRAEESGQDPDDPVTIKQLQIPTMPTMETAQAKLSTPPSPNNQVLFNDDGKPGQLTPQQQAAEQSYLKANPNTTPEAFGSFMSSLVGRPVANAGDILNHYSKYGNLNSVIQPDPRAVAIANQRLASGGNSGAAAIQGGLSAIPFHNQIGGAIDTITGNGSPSYGVNRDANFLYDEGLASRHPIPYYGGQLAGGTALLGGAGGAGAAALRLGKAGGAAETILDAATNSPRAATTLGDMAYGGLTNAGQNPDSPGVAGIEGTLAGLGGSALGHGLQMLGGKAFSAAGRRLSDLGINVPIWPRLLPGGNARVADQNQQLNREIFNQSSNIVGGDAGEAPDLASLKGLGQDAYSDALNPVTGFNLSPTAQTVVTDAFNRANGLKNPEARDYALRSLNQHIVGNFTNGTMDGAGFQGAYKGLSNDISGISKLADNGKISPSEQGNLTGILGQGQDALVGSLQSAYPDAFDKFAAANSLWRHMNVIGKAQDTARNAVDASGTPIPTAPQLSNASSANTRAYSGIMAAAQGDRPFNQLLNDANYAGAKSGGSGLGGFFSHAALPSLAFLAGGGAGAEEDGKEGAGIGALSLGALAAMLGSRGGQAVLRRGLANAPNIFSAGFVPLTPNLNNGAR